MRWKTVIFIISAVWNLTSFACEHSFTDNEFPDSDVELDEKFLRRSTRFRTRYSNILITDRELLALDFYLSSGYYEINSGLYHRRVDLMRKHKKAIFLLHSLIRKLQDASQGYFGVVERYMELNEAQLQRYREGEVLIEPNFLSTSKSMEIESVRKRNTRFIIEANGLGVDVSPLQWKKENEVLFPPNVHLLVQKITRSEAQTTIFMFGIVEQ